MAKKQDTCSHTYAWLEREVFEDGEDWYKSRLKYADEHITGARRDVQSGKSKNWNCGQSSIYVNEMERAAGLLHAASIIAEKSKVPGLHAELISARNWYETRVSKLRKAFQGTCLTSWEQKPAKAAGVSGTRRKPVKRKKRS